MVFRGPPPSQSTSVARAHHASLHPWPPRRISLQWGRAHSPSALHPQQPRGAAQWECPAPLARTRPGSGRDGVGALRSRPPGRPSHTHPPPRPTPASPAATQRHASHVPLLQTKAHGMGRGSGAEQRPARPARLSPPSPRPSPPPLQPRIRAHVGHIPRIVPRRPHLVGHDRRCHGRVKALGEGPLERLPDARQAVDPRRRADASQSPAQLVRKVVAVSSTPEPSSKRKHTKRSSKANHAAKTEGVSN